MTNFLCYSFKFNKTEEPFGGVVEWFKALVLKTSVSARVPWVRIPPPPYLQLTFIKTTPKGVFLWLFIFDDNSLNFALFHVIR